MLRSIDLRGIGLIPLGEFTCLIFAELEFTDFSSLMAENPPYFRRNGCPYRSTDAVEREHLALGALLEALPGGALIGYEE